jgi:hypothetical protein
MREPSPSRRPGDDATSAVGEHLRALFGELVAQHLQKRSFLICLDDVSARVEILDCVPGEVVSVSSLVAVDVPRSEELYEFLLRENTALVFGALGGTDDGDLILEHCLLAEGLTKPQLGAAVHTVAIAGKAIGVEVTQAFGGMTARQYFERQALS